MTDSTTTTTQNIRYALGVFGANAVLVTEEEITHFLGLYPDSWRLAAAALAESLAARAINSPSSFAVPGELSVSWTDRAKAWLSIATSLRKEVAAVEDASLEPVGIQRTQLIIESGQYTPEYGAARMRKGIR